MKEEPKEYMEDPGMSIGCAIFACIAFLFVGVFLGAMIF